ncbi:MAG: HupE/UreJ family protein [Gammaproteobacteria bacterium]|nr:HupE/UreJ family protein [Gammaproteobacteria bacterium]
MMFKKLFGKIALLSASVASSTAFAHTGIHNELYHPLSGVDHFLVILIIGLLAAITTYYFYKK